MWFQRFPVTFSVVQARGVGQVYVRHVYAESAVLFHTFSVEKEGTPVAEREGTQRSDYYTVLSEKYEFTASEWKQFRCFCR